MRSPILAVALAACLPAAAFAQKSRGGDPTTPGGSSAPTAAPSARAPSSRDLADLNPAAMLVSKHKKASLADSTVKQLKAVEKKIDERNASFFATYDSVHKWTMPLASGAVTSTAKPGFVPGDNQLATSTSSPAELAKMQSSMRDLRLLMVDFRDRHKADAADALEVIPEAQKKAAGDLLSQQDGELDKLIGGRP